MFYHRQSLTNGYSSRKVCMTNHIPTPRSEDPEDIKRRDFIKGLVGAVMGFLTLSMTWPFASYLIPLSSGAKEDRFIKVPNFPAIPVGTPSKMTFEDIHQDTFIKSKVVYDVWVIKHSNTEATVYSPVCPHLACRYSVNNDRFACPCHGSVFSMEGKVLGGPAPRPLDTLPSKIEGGELFVQWKLYKAGIPEKVEA